MFVTFPNSPFVVFLLPVVQFLDFPLNSTYLDIFSLPFEQVDGNRNVNMICSDHAKFDIQFFLGLHSIFCLSVIHLGLLAVQTSQKRPLFAFSVHVSALYSRLTYTKEGLIQLSFDTSTE